MPNQPRVVVVDHAFHRQTTSSKFFFELLSNCKVSVLHDDIGAQCLLEKMRAAAPEAIVFFQTQPKPAFLRALRHPNVTWVPMRDDLRYDASRVRLLSGSTIKLINFCQEAHSLFSSRGLSSLAVQYWPTPQTAPVVSGRSKPRLFLWDRGYIQWPTLKRMIGTQEVDGVVLRLAPDPGREVVRPDADDLLRYRITLVEGWLDHDHYLSLLRDCDIFVAPRPLEGIGMAMLEAMSHGLAILAPRHPTMNEYVRHTENGWLFELGQTEPVSFANWPAAARQAWQDCTVGARQWIKQREAVADFILTPSQRREKLWWRLAARVGL